MWILPSLEVASLVSIVPSALRKNIPKATFLFWKKAVCRKGQVPKMRVLPVLGVPPKFYRIWTIIQRKKWWNWFKSAGMEFKDYVIYWAIMLSIFNCKIGRAHV